MGNSYPHVCPVSPSGATPVSLRSSLLVTTRQLASERSNYIATFVCLPEDRQQRLSFGGLRHLGCRRKTFEYRGKDGVRFSGAAGRFAELGERQRRA
jgi:hypothetical protein